MQSTTANNLPFLTLNEFDSVGSRKYLIVRCQPAFRNTFANIPQAIPDLKNTHYAFPIVSALKLFTVCANVAIKQQNIAVKVPILYQRDIGRIFFMELFYSHVLL